MRQQGVEIISEPTGFKLMLAGTASWVGSALASLDWAQVAGFIVAVTGLVMQIAAYRRNQEADRREREKHELDMALLRKRLEAATHEPHAEGQHGD
jgi:membrane protein implicated in regulation of membrane protease activity